MTMLENIKAALTHLAAIAGEVESGIEHDAERLAGDLRDFLHLGYASITSRRGEAPVAAPAAGTQ